MAQIVIVEALREHKSLGDGGGGAVTRGLLHYKWPTRRAMKRVGLMVLHHSYFPAAPLVRPWRGEQLLQLRLSLSDGSVANRTANSTFSGTSFPL